jgi:chemotaxis protein histidine kinase CheA
MTTCAGALSRDGRPAFRDAETIALFGEFLREGEESLARVDRMLMTIERDHASAETINDLFRVFHTIKGTAGFLELTDISSLAHTTETMLNRCREGALAFAGTPLNLVFDATSLMRSMLNDLRASIEQHHQLARQGHSCCRLTPQIQHGYLRSHRPNSHHRRPIYMLRPTDDDGYPGRSGP